MARNTLPIPNRSDLHDYFSYDGDTGKLFMRNANQFKNVGDEAGWANDIGYRQVHFRGKVYLVHRIIWAMHYGSFEGEVDHINGNRGDNRLCNLRNASSSQQNQNRRIGSRNKSGIKGVFWVTRHRKFRAVIVLNYKTHVIGHFTDIGAAAEAVAMARHDFHKDFANHGSAP